jgi:hypothetical protein
MLLLRGGLSASVRSFTGGGRHEDGDEGRASFAMWA